MLDYEAKKQIFHIVVYACVCFQIASVDSTVKKY